MKHNFDGWFCERLPSGNLRHRVRVEGDKSRKITIPVGPDHPDFLNHYWAARQGQRHEAGTNKAAPVETLRWLVDDYLANLADQVAGGLKSLATLKQRRSQLSRLCAMKDKDGDTFGALHFDLPPSAFVRARDAMMRTPGEADNTMKSARALYAYAMERDLIKANPVAGVKKINPGTGGAKPWTAESLKRYRDVHPSGTMAHLYVTLLMFTGCRISDAFRLGRKNEVVRNGVTWLDWQPAKKGSAPVSMPIQPTLLRTIRAMKVQGETYILNARGRPFGSAESMRNSLQDWCREAGLVNHTSHGIRKAMAELLAELGCTEYQIMAVLSHTQSATTSIYTQGVRRRILAGDAVAAMTDIEW